VLTKVVPEDLPPIEGDPQRLHQVLGNVLSNAVKFTPEGGRIDVEAAVADDAIEITVRDSGIGIAPEFLPFVFDRFRQADSRSTRRHGGLGLGLAIARHLLEQHGGGIQAHSGGPGRGTTVRMRLPIRTLGHTSSTQAEAGPPSQHDLRMDGSAVVVVDDQRDSRELLAALLERGGARVVQCDSAESALAALNGSRFDLLVADIAMPDVDGYELIRRVRQRNSHLPAVAVSAYARPQDRKRALAAGFNEYCAKPIEARQFLQTAREMIRGAASSGSR
jgi:CheY-like chemotaxis protein